MASGRVKKSILNLSTSMLYYLLTFILRFAVRDLFLQNLGVSILGYNSTFSNILGMLNLSELGIGIAITYKMYEPVAKQQYDKIASLLSIYKRLYFKIGLFILVVGFVIIPFLPIILKESYDIIFSLAIYFILNLLVTVSTYWMSYKRIVFNVYQESYFINIVDSITVVIITVLQIVDLIVWKSYIGYLILLLVQVIVSNIILSICCDKRHTEINGRKTSKHLISIKEISKDIKNVVIAKLGVYVLNSTDALVISAILGADYTGYMTNYSTVYISFQTMVVTVFSVLQSSIGNKIVEDKNTQNTENVIMNISFLAQMIASCFSVVAYFMIDEFISIWVGNQYILDKNIAMAFSVNVFVFILLYPISMLFGALGYYNFEKKVVCVSALLNISLSVILVNTNGILGVLIGTFVALVIYWASRIFIIYKHYYKFSKKGYCIRVLKYAVEYVIGLIVCKIAHNLLKAEVFSLSHFIIESMALLAIMIVLNIVFNLKSKEMKYAYNILKKLIYRKS